MKRKNSGGGSEHLYTDVKRDLTTEQLAAVGAVTLAWNGLEGCIDAIFVLVTDTPPEMAMDIVTRINGFDGKTAVIKKALKTRHHFPQNLLDGFDLAIDSATECKIFRDAVIHAHVSNKDLGHGNAKRGATYSVVLSQEALDGLYDRITATTSELVAITWALALLKVGPKMRTVEEQASIATASVICAIQFRNFQKIRQSLPPLPACPDAPPIQIELGDGLYQSFYRLLGITTPPPVKDGPAKDALEHLNELSRKARLSGKSIEAIASEVPTKSDPPSPDQ